MISSFTSVGGESTRSGDRGPSPPRMENDRGKGGWRVEKVLIVDILKEKNKIYGTEINCEVSLWGI